MASKINKDERNYFACEECKLLYRNKNWAEKCEAWCKEHHSCNLEITRHSIKKTREELCL